MAATVADAATMLDALGPPPGPGGWLAHAAAVDVTRLRIGTVGVAFDEADPEVAAEVETALGALAAAGCTVMPAAPPPLRRPRRRQRRRPARQPLRGEHPAPQLRSRPGPLLGGGRRAARGGRVGRRPRLPPGPAPPPGPGRGDARRVPRPRPAGHAHGAGGGPSRGGLRRVPDASGPQRHPVELRRASRPSPSPAGGWTASPSGSSSWPPPDARTCSSRWARWSSG